MFLLADEHSEFDNILWDSIAAKAKNGELTAADLSDCFKVLCAGCNHIDELRFELRSYSGSYQFVFDGERYALVFRSGACSAFSGDVEQPDITVWMGLDVARDLLMGNVNSGAAHMNGDIRYKGTKNGAITLQSVFELFLDELSA